MQVYDASPEENNNGAEAGGKRLVQTLIPS